VKIISEDRVDYEKKNGFCCGTIESRKSDQYDLNCVCMQLRRLYPATILADQVHSHQRWDYEQGHRWLYNLFATAMQSLSLYSSEEFNTSVTGLYDEPRSLKAIIIPRIQPTQSQIPCFPKVVRISPLFSTPLKETRRPRPLQSEPPRF